jgi:copper(I)-binding protein
LLHVPRLYNPRLTINLTGIKTVRVLLQLLLIATVLMCGNAVAGNITIENAWARATAPGQDMGSVDLSITSTSAASLTGVSSTICSTVELHRMTHEDGMMKMRQVDSIALDAGKTLSLSGAGYHLMLVGLRSPLEAGKHIPLTLTIKQKAGQVEQVQVSAEVRGLTSSGAMPAEHEHHH